jgi:hypothetical protein
VHRAGTFSIILKDDHGKTVIVPTKNIADRHIVIELRPSSDKQEHKVGLESTKQL